MMDIRGLAYVVAESRDPSRWKDYGEHVLGAMACDAPDGGAYLKIDERSFLILAQRGAADCYFASGWEVAGKEAFDAAVADLERTGIEFNRASDAELDSRKVREMVWCLDPSANRHEIVWGFKTDGARFESPQGVSGFVTGNLGMGHAVLPAANFDATWNFMHEVMGFGITDTIKVRFTQDPQEPEKRIYFLHCNNRRHHSTALFEFPMPNGCVHLMLEVKSIDDVGRAFDRMQKNEVKLMATLGRHINDDMISFYMMTPGNFPIEYGWGGKVMDWSRHLEFELTAPSHWGHDFSVGFKF